MFVLTPVVDRSGRPEKLGIAFFLRFPDTERRKHRFATALCLDIAQAVANEVRSRVENGDCGEENSDRRILGRFR